MSWFEGMHFHFHDPKDDFVLWGTNNLRLIAYLRHYRVQVHGVSKVRLAIARAIMLIITFALVTVVFWALASLVAGEMVWPRSYAGFGAFIGVIIGMFIRLIIDKAEENDERQDATDLTQ